MLDFKPSRRKTRRFSPLRRFGRDADKSRRSLTRGATKRSKAIFAGNPTTEVRQIRLRLPRMRRPPLRLIYGAIAVWLIGGTGFMAVELWRAPLRNVNVEGALRLTAQEVTAMAGLKAGLSMSALDPYEVASRISRHPRIRTVDVRRVFPNSVRITIQEREPVARILPRGGGGVLIDGLGIVIGAANMAGDAGAALPTIIGIDGPLRAGMIVAAPELSRALEAIRALETAGLGPSNEPGQSAALVLDVSDPFEVRLRIPGNSQEILLPGEGMTFALSHYMALSNAGSESFGRARRVDLRLAGVPRGGRIVLIP